MKIYLTNEISYIYSRQRDGANSREEAKNGTVLAAGELPLTTHYSIPSLTVSPLCRSNFTSNVSCPN